MFILGGRPLPLLGNPIFDLSPYAYYRFEDDYLEGGFVTEAGVVIANEGSAGPELVLFAYYGEDDVTDGMQYGEGITGVTGRGVVWQGRMLQGRMESANLTVGNQGTIFTCLYFDSVLDLNGTGSYPPNFHGNYGQVYSPGSGRSLACGFSIANEGAGGGFDKALRAKVGIGAGSFIQGAVEITEPLLDKWHVVAMRWSQEEDGSGNIQFYLDGDVFHDQDLSAGADPIMTSGIFSTSSLGFGIPDILTTSSRARGKIDEYVWWQDALGDADLETVMTYLQGRCDAANL